MNVKAGHAIIHVAAEGTDISRGKLSQLFTPKKFTRGGL